MPAPTAPIADVDPSRISQKFLVPTASATLLEVMAAVAMLVESLEDAPSGSRPDFSGVDRVIQIPTGSTTAISVSATISSAWRQPYVRIKSFTSNGATTPP